MPSSPIDYILSLEGKEYKSAILKIADACYHPEPVHQLRSAEQFREAAELFRDDIDDPVRVAALNKERQAYDCPKTWGIDILIAAKKSKQSARFTLGGAFACAPQYGRGLCSTREYWCKVLGIAE